MDVLYIRASKWEYQGVANTLITIMFAQSKEDGVDLIEHGQTQTEDLLRTEAQALELR